LGSRRVGSGEPRRAGAKRHVDGAGGLLDCGPAGAFCIAMARRKDRENAAGAAPGRNAEGVWTVVQGVCGSRKEGRNSEVAGWDKKRFERDCGRRVTS